jgi:hypothetical protein
MGLLNSCHKTSLVELTFRPLNEGLKSGKIKPNHDQGSCYIFLSNYLFFGEQIYYALFIASSVPQILLSIFQYLAILAT